MDGRQREIIWSFGGGVQTMCILVLIAQKQLPKPALAIMANTGRERQSTWDYLEQHAKPLMSELNIPFVIAGHDLATVDLYAHNGDLLLPSYTQSGKLPAFCSDEWKKLVVRRKLRELGYGPKNPVINWIGMSLDETHRLRHSDKKWIKSWWPLCFDVKRRRHECILEVKKFGLPEPPKSSCWMCPNMQNPQWLDMKTNQPEDWRKAVEVDYLTRDKDTEGGVYLHRDRVPLDKADLTIEHKDLPLLECANVCWT